MVVDVGGTNTRVALAGAGAVDPSTIVRYKNDDLDSIEDAVSRYVAQAGVPPLDGICACIAGPVQGNTGGLTNRDWTTSVAALTSASGAVRGTLINDLQAQAHALPALGAGDLRPLHKGTPTPSAPRLAVNIGTGFNAAVALPHGQDVIVPPSECGHISLPVSTPKDQAFAAALAGEHGFAAIEDAMSGRGIERLHTWRLTGKIAPAVASSSQIMARRGDAEVEATIQAFARLFGVVCGDLALTFLPFGGLYLVGGLAVALAADFQGRAFREAMLAKGRFRDTLAPIPVHVVTDDYAALKGCARCLTHGGPVV